MNIYGAVIFGLLIGVIFGSAFADQIVAALSWLLEAVLVVVMFIPFCFYYTFRFVVHPADADRWEANKHYFKYKEIFKNFYVCYEPNASRPWKLIFFMRLKSY